MADKSLDVLIATAKAGDAAALDHLLVHYRPYLRLIAGQAIGPALGRRYDGSDIAQQTCIEAVDAFATFQGKTEEQLSAWLKQILRRNVSNLIRDNRAAKRDIRRDIPLYTEENSATLNWHEPEAGDTSPSANVLRGEAALELAVAVEQLPDDQRTAITMRYLEGKPLIEIAEELGRTNSAVAGLLHRGLRALRDKVEMP